MLNPYIYTKKRILIVDDQRAFQLMLKAMLQNFGATDIHFASTGEQASRLCKKIPFDLLLVDYSLGSGKNGAQLLEELRTFKNISPGALFFIISGENSKSMVLNALEMEPDDFITKPFSQFQLHTRISRAYNKRQELISVHTAFSDNNYQQAEKSAEEYLKGSGRYIRFCRNLLIEAKISLNDYAGAREELEKSLNERQPTWTKATLGRVYQLMRETQPAIETLAEAVKESPLLLFAYDSLAQAYQDNGEHEKALETIQHANSLSPYSINRQQLMAELALDAQDFTLAKETFGTILQLARRSIHKGPQHLCNFIRSLIDEAQHEPDLYRKNRLLQEVSSVMLKARHEEGKDEEFDFNAFEGLSQARVHATKGDLNKAKRILFDSNKEKIDTPEQIDDMLLPDTFLTMNLVGEYEYAVPLNEELQNRQNLDPIALKCVNDVSESPEFKNRLNNFKNLNKLGIQAYEKETFEEAYTYFNKALTEAPGNTGAILNKIQVSLKLLDKKSFDRSISPEECKKTINSLAGLQLNASHKSRYESLCSEFELIKKRRKIL